MTKKIPKTTMGTGHFANKITLLLTENSPKTPIQLIVKDCKLFFGTIKPPEKIEVTVEWERPVRIKAVR